MRPVHSIASSRLPLWLKEREHRETCIMRPPTREPSSPGAAPERSSTMPPAHCIIGLTMLAASGAAATPLPVDAVETGGAGVLTKCPSCAVPNSCHTYHHISPP